MDLTIRDWMVIIGVLLILAVLLDAWRRVRSDSYSRVKVKLAEPEEIGPESDADLSWLKELPNGGGRTVERGDLLKAAGRDRSGRDRSGRDRSGRDQPAGDSRRRPASDAATLPQGDAPEKSAASAPDEVELVAGMSTSGTADEPENMDWLDGIGSGDAQAPDEEPETTAGRLPREIDPEVFMLNVVSRNSDGFRGEDILHILLACDLRFGDMSFFHRHEFEAGRGAIQFSVANMMQPGVFDIDNMAEMNTPGLVFFLTLPGPEDMMKAFDYMLETAQAVARNLGGDVLDESRSVLTRQTMEHSRQKIRDLERRLLAKTR